LKVGDLIRPREKDGWRLVRNPGEPSTVQASEQARDCDLGWQDEPGCDAGYSELNTQASGPEAVRCATIRYMVVIERGETSWGAHVPDLPGCIAVGETRDEVLRLIREAIGFHIEGLKQEGLPIPVPSSEGELVEVGAA